MTTNLKGRNASGMIPYVVLVMVVLSVIALAAGDPRDDDPGVFSGNSVRSVEPGDSPSPGADESTAASYTRAPDFSLDAMDGSVFRLSEMEGQSIVVLNFWATWCGPCRVEIPGFIRLDREFQGVRFVGVSLDEEGFDVVQPFAEELGIIYPLVIGNDSLASQYGGILGLPTTYVIDRDGLIRQRFVGMVDETTLGSVLRNLQ